MTTKITEEDLQSALPDVTSTLCTAELQFPVTIIRDNFGIPRASVRDRLGCTGPVPAAYWQVSS